MRGVPATAEEISPGLGVWLSYESFRPPFRHGRRLGAILGLRASAVRRDCRRGMCAASGGNTVPLATGAGLACLRTPGVGPHPPPAALHACAFRRRDFA